MKTSIAGGAGTNVTNFNATCVSPVGGGNNQAANNKNQKTPNQKKLMISKTMKLAKQTNEEIDNEFDYYNDDDYFVSEKNTEQEVASSLSKKEN